MGILEIKDFSGGITDNYLDAALNKYQRADNYRVRTDKKLETVPGSVIYDSTTYQIPAGQQRVSDLLLFQEQLFTQSARNLYYASGGSWTTLQGPSSNAALPAGAVTNFLARAEWNNHLIVTSDAFGSPQKVYKDSSGTFRVRNAGLPKVTLTACIALANELKTDFNLHIADATEHTTAVDTTNVVSAADAYDFPSLIALTTELLTDYDAHEADAELASAWVYHVAQETGDHSVTSTAAPETLSDVKDRLDDLKSKYNAHDADTTTHAADSLHQIAKYSEPQIASAGGSGNNYVYAFHAYFEYTVGDVVYRDYGPTHTKALSNVGTPNTNTVTVSQIPVIANGTTENFDTATIKWYIYRTEHNGTVYRYIGNVTNGTTTYSDTASDASIASNTQLYTTGGVKDNDPPPQAKYVVTANDIVWYGHIKEGGVIRKNRIRASVKFDPDSCPESFYRDVEDEITGMGYIGIYPIVFCKRHIYRIEGFKDDTGRGTIEAKEISRSVGSVNHNSIVNTLEGIFFAGNDGFYFTDGYKAIKITAELDSSYTNLVASATAKARIYGRHILNENRIYWGCQEDSSSTDNDAIWMLDLSFGVKPDAVFTKRIPSTSSWTPCAIALDSDESIVVADRRGYLFKLDSGATTDPAIDVSTTPDNWTTKTVVVDYRGPGINFGTTVTRKWPQWCHMIIENFSPVTLEIQHKNDDSGYFAPLKEIRYRDHIIWGDSSATAWMPTPDLYPWKTFPMIIEKRRFSKNGIRCTYKQIRFTNARTNITRSDDVGTATVYAVAKTVVLNAGSWDSDVTDYKIAFENDSYELEYTIITRNSASTITYQDPLSTSVSSSTRKWVLKGERKRERLNVLSYALEWEDIGSSVATYAGNTGGNA